MAGTTITVHSNGAAAVEVIYLKQTDTFAASVEDRNGIRVEFFLTPKQLDQFHGALLEATCTRNAHKSSMSEVPLE